MAKDSLLDDLNEPQRQAVTHIGNPLLVLAGAGSGKTRVITTKFAYMVKRKRFSPHSILAVTFTNRASDEMKERTKGLINCDTKNLWIGTFHSQCNRILRKEIHHLGFKHNFTIYDEDDQCTLIRQILKELNIYEALYKNIASRISILKASLVTPDKFLSQGDGFSFDEKIAKVYVRYQDELKRAEALDFDDLIMFTVRLFTEHPKVLERYRKQFEYVLIDEFQDTNHAQYMLANIIVGKDGNFCAVGDDDQSIYKFRGANVGNIHRLKADHSRLKIIKLEQNYRSTKNIINVSSKVIQGNASRSEKTLWTENECGEKVCYCLFNNEEEEAKHVARTIKDLYLKGFYEYSDMAILYRINLQAKAIEDGLREASIPYTIFNGISFYNRREIKDVIAYLKLILNPHDNVSLRRVLNVPPRGIGISAINKIEQEAKRNSTSLYTVIKQIISSNNSFTSSIKDKLSSFVNTIDDLIGNSQKTASDIMRAVVNKTNYLETLEDERVQNVIELINSSEGISLQAFLDKTALMSGFETSNNCNSVSMMTLHGAKGLEFSVVFLVGLEEGILPYCKALEDAADMEEERRLFYVGMTRAKERLYMSSVRRRKLYSKVQERQPSRFINDVPKDCCNWMEKTVSPTVQTEKPSTSNTVNISFDIGCRVKHPSWGVGIVRECCGNGDTAKVVVNFPGIGIKKLIAGLANLERISV
ncbi:MAG: UvrD-helicase domain-containing protein [Thermodesulfovibrionales bacterium]|nr:UvrD-helicase domain-containing protein [Thermodesulfovibrionales bacterium]